MRSCHDVLLGRPVPVSAFFLLLPLLWDFLLGALVVLAGEGHQRLDPLHGVIQRLLEEQLLRGQTEGGAALWLVRRGVSHAKGDGHGVLGGVDPQDLQGGEARVSSKHTSS